jgi:transcriptional regulator with XRE-family HTH domain
MGNAAPEPPGQALTRLRIAAGLSIRELAAKAGVGATSIGEAERGRMVTRGMAADLAKVLGPAVHDAVTVWPPLLAPHNATTPLARARAESGESIPQAATRAGVTRAVYQRAERGEGVRPGNAKRLAEAFGLDVTDVLPLPHTREGTNHVAA